jgi:hypothetical protein
MGGQLAGLSYRLHAFGLLALLIKRACTTKREARLARIPRTSGTKRCLATGSFGHRRSGGMLAGRGRCRLAPGCLVHGGCGGMLGSRPLLGGGRLTRGLPTRVLR